MKAIIEESDGLYIVRIHESNGLLCDIYVVDEVELKPYDWNGDFKGDLVELAL